MPILDYLVQNGGSTRPFSGMPDSIVFLVALIPHRVHPPRKTLDEPASGWLVTQALAAASLVIPFGQLGIETAVK